MFELQITTTGEQELQLAFVEAEAVFADWTPAFEKLAPESTAFIQNRFEQEGPGWERLSAKYAEWKAKFFPGKTILRRTDLLFDSFAKGGPGNVTQIEPLEATFGSYNFYGQFQPQTRLIVDVTEDIEQRLMMIALDEQNRRLRDLGLEIN